MTNRPTDLRCCKCKYDLRGIRADGRCPECATSVRESIDKARQTHSRNVLVRYPILCVLTMIFSLFHLVTVSLPVWRSGGSGEEQAFAVLILDCPLVYVVEHAFGSTILNGGAQDTYIFVFAVLGLVMYALVGAALGFAIDRIRMRFCR